MLSLISKYILSKLSFTLLYTNLVCFNSSVKVLTDSNDNDLSNKLIWSLFFNEKKSWSLFCVNIDDNKNELIFPIFIEIHSLTALFPDFKVINSLLLIVNNSTYFVSNLFLSAFWCKNVLVTIYFSLSNENINLTHDVLPFSFCWQIIDDENCLLVLLGIPSPNRLRHIISKNADFPEPFGAFNKLTFLSIVSKLK